MKYKLLNGIKLIIFIAVLLLTVYAVMETLIAKDLYNEREIHTYTQKGFYNMQKNTIDVLILGTSHAAAAFNPQDFYDRDNIRAYNLASQAQPVWLSYYWLEEALKYQKPAAVIFECNYLFNDDVNNEATRRKTLDNMRWGRVKYNAIKTINKLDENCKERPIEYLFSTLRYHDRWKELNETDFTWANSKSESILLKGFWIDNNIARNDTYELFKDVDESAGMADFLEPSFGYFQRIVELCEKNEIELILVKAPCHTFDKKKHNAVQKYADEQGLSFVDFNESQILNQIDYNYSNGDMNDIYGNSAHTNTSGARKISYYLADYISDRSLAPSVEDEQWEISKQFNDDLYRDFMLRNSKDFNKYLSLLNPERHTILLSVVGEDNGDLTDDQVAFLKDLGLGDHVDNSLLHKKYIAVIENGNVINESWSDGDVEFKGSFDNGKKRVFMNSLASYADCESSMQIDNVEYSLRNSGLNIVVYSNQRGCVIDSVSFCVTDEGIECIR